MATTALIAKVPEAEAVVGALRTRYDAAAQAGVPAHITILAPFMAPDEITLSVLRRIRHALHAVPAFTYSLESIGRFDATAFLAPTPAEPFVSLTASVVAEFPAFPPYGGLHSGIIPHLTVAHGDAHAAAVAATELESRLREHPPISARCGIISLLENASGRWKEMHTFELPA